MYKKQNKITADLSFEGFLKKSSKLHLFCAIFAVVFSFIVSGCQAPGYIPPDAPKIITQSFAERRILGFSAQNRPIEAITIGNGPDIILFIATIHGNEPAGTPLVHKLTEYLLKNRYLLDNRTVILLPLLNPDGYADNTRTNSNGIDLNRNYAAENRINSDKYGKVALSEIESKIIVRLIARYQPNRIVTLHQPLACVDYDGPAIELAEHMGECCDLPVRRIGAQPGSLGSYAGVTLQIPIITFEMRKQDSQLSPEELWQKYGPAMLASITFPERLM